MKLTANALVCFVLLLICTVALAEENKPETIASIDNFIDQQAKALDGRETGPRETSKPFDFDGLRDPDIAVLYRISKDNDTTQYLAVFEQSEDTWHLTHHIRLGGRGLRHVTQFLTTDRIIEIHALELQGTDSLSSPSLKVQIALAVKNGLLDITRTAENN